MKTSYLAAILSSSTVVLALPGWAFGSTSLVARTGDDNQKTGVDDNIASSGRDHPEDNNHGLEDDHPRVTKTRPEVPTGRRGRWRNRKHGHGRKGKGKGKDDKDCDDDDDDPTPSVAPAPPFGLIGNGTIIGNGTLASNSTALNATIISTTASEDSTATPTAIDDNGADSPLSSVEARALNMLGALLGH